MKLFIQIKDGQPYEHPIMDWNFYEAFPNIDINNLPPEFANFQRVECNVEVGIYEVAECYYDWDETKTFVKDVWKIRPMNEEERMQKDLFLSDVIKVDAESSLRNLENSGSVPNVII